MISRLIFTLLSLSLFTACSGVRSQDGTTYPLGLPHISVPHLGAPEIYRGQLQKSAQSGRPVQLWGDTSLTPNCDIEGETRLEIKTPPANGVVTIRPGRLYALYPEGDRRQACSGRLVNGVLAFYIAQNGYVGPDQVVLRGTTADGEVREVVVDIAVHAPSARTAAPLAMSAPPATAPPLDVARRPSPVPIDPDHPPAVLQTPYPN